MGAHKGAHPMKYDWRMTTLYLVTGIIFTCAIFFRTVSTPLLLLAALVFLGLGIYRLVMTLKK
jgi:hypothetical protein